MRVRCFRFACVFQQDFCEGYQERCCLLVARARACARDEMRTHTRAMRTHDHQTWRALKRVWAGDTRARARAAHSMPCTSHTSKNTPVRRRKASPPHRRRRAFKAPLRSLVRRTRRAVLQAAAPQGREGKKLPHCVSVCGKVRQPPKQAVQPGLTRGAKMMPPPQKQKKAQQANHSGTPRPPPPTRAQLRAREGRTRRHRLRASPPAQEAVSSTTLLFVASVSG